VYSSVTRWKTAKKSKVGRAPIYELPKAFIKLIRSAEKIKKIKKEIQKKSEIPEYKTICVNLLQYHVKWALDDIKELKANILKHSDSSKMLNFLTPDGGFEFTRYYDNE